jgi:hypothetical protein
MMPLAAQRDSVVRMKTEITQTLTSSLSALQSLFCSLQLLTCFLSQIV